jgi:hypothetical protein
VDNSIRQDRTHAERYIEKLTGSKDTPVTFQTFPDSAGPRGRLLDEDDHA